jgi:small subunit ribosomal protein S17
VSDQAKIVTSGKKEFVGLVKNTKRINDNGKVVGMDKTIVVSVETMALHPLYKKYVRKVKRIKAHDEYNTARTGDKVRVRECRPISKDKCWKLVEVIEQAK